MDTLLLNGDHFVDARGVPVVVEGGRELIQRALIRLQVKKGSFPQDPSLGSELYKLRRTESEVNNRMAMSYVQEALAPIPQLMVTSVAAKPHGLDSLRVEVGLQVEGLHYRLEVNVAT